ncbi:MAG: ABC transporter ATP-binding protein [Firmicutes bacterium]|nr:ABC transporter ATP-binding protein [Candidatus Alectryobacillus merdavium]
MNKEAIIDKDCILQIEHLSKSYGDLKAVDDISLKVKKGSLFSFLGMNGAGKSTTINIICSILKKDSGKIYVNGYDLDKDVNKIKEEIGIVFQNSVLDNDLTVYQNLKVRASFYGFSKKEEKEKINNIVNLLQLNEILDKPINKLSGGQKRRVDIARSMIHNPKLLILDEPTTGLDPKTRLMVWNLINEIRNKTGMNVFLTTHYMEEAEESTYIVIMNKGKIISEGTPLELKNKYTSDYIKAYLDKNEQLEELLNKDKIQYSYFEENNFYKIYIKNSELSVELLNKYKDYIKDFEILKGDMDDVFLNAINGYIINKE